MTEDHWRFSPVTVAMLRRQAVDRILRLRNHIRLVGHLFARFGATLAHRTQQGGAAMVLRLEWICGQRGDPASRSGYKASDKETDVGCFVRHVWDSRAKFFYGLRGPQ
jgi:hypothetical protein